MNKQHFKKLLNVSSPILITGATGTGKSKMARRIFELSSIHQDKFLTLHLASLKEELFESELFGHKKGAFTGAVENKNGYLADTGKGTLFLDEIGELSLEAQKKLLYLLEEKKYTPVGSTSAHSFEGRLIMATNKDLKKMVEAGTFREDLYFRLNVFLLELVPLASNREKLQREIEKGFELAKNNFQRECLRLSDELFQILLNAEWKGNYRELKNCLEYIVVMSDKPLVEKDSLPHWFASEKAISNVHSKEGFISHFPGDFTEALEIFESWYLMAQLKKHEGKINETARLLGISKTTLISKAKKYGIDTLTLRAEAGRLKSLKLAA